MLMPAVTLLAPALHPPCLPKQSTSLKACIVVDHVPRPTVCISSFDLFMYKANLNKQAEQIHGCATRLAQNWRMSESFHVHYINCYVVIWSLTSAVSLSSHDEDFKHTTSYQPVNFLYLEWGEKWLKMCLQRWDVLQMKLNWRQTCHESSKARLVQASRLSVWKSNACAYQACTIFTVLSVSKAS